MNFFKNKNLVGLLSAGFLLITLIVQSQNNENVLRIYMDWQTSNCGLNEDNILIRNLLENAVLVEPLLLQGFEEGAPKDYLDETLGAEMERLRKNKELISKQQIQTGLSDEDLKIAIESDPESASERITQSIHRGWKTRALSGLGVLKTEGAMELLKSISEDKSNEFNSLAIAILSQNKEEE